MCRKKNNKIPITLPQGKIYAFYLVEVADQTHLSASKYNDYNIPFRPSLGVPRHPIWRFTTDFAPNDTIVMSTLCAYDIKFIPMIRASVAIPLLPPLPRRRTPITAAMLSANCRPNRKQMLWISTLCLHKLAAIRKRKGRHETTNPRLFTAFREWCMSDLVDRLRVI